MHLSAKDNQLKESIQTVIRSSKESDIREQVEKWSKKKKLSMSAWIRSEVLKDLENNPLKELAPKPPEQSLHLLSQVSPDAIVYLAPATDIKVVAAPDEDAGWRGVVFNPGLIDSLEVWNSENLNVPKWSRTQNLWKTLLFISSRIDDGGESFFDLPDSEFLISAVFEGDRWNKGRIINGRTKASVPWIRDNYYSIVDPGDDPLRWGGRRNIRRFISVLTSAITCGNGGLDDRRKAFIPK